MLAVSTANATVVTQSNIVGANGVTVSVPTSGTNKGKVQVSGPNLPTVNDATLTIQKNGTSVGTFTANASSAKTINITMAKGDVGLGNVDNTSDADKPVSTATQTALDAKQDKLNSGTGGNVTISTNNASASGVVKTVTADDGTVTVTRGTIASGDITNSAVGANQLASNAVTTVKIKDANVTAPKLADGVVASGSDNVTVTRDSTTSAFKISVTAQDISGKEDVANKVTATSGTDYTNNKTSTTKYPSMATANQLATDAINALDVSTATNGGTANNVVTAVTETNGKISVTKGDAINAVAATASSGTGNVITGISLNADGHTLDFQKGITALTSHQDISGKENTSNKVTVTSGTGYDKTSTTKYPSMKTATQIATEAASAAVSGAAGNYATAAQGAKADTAVQSVTLASGTNNGTVKLTVDGTTTDNIAVKGLGSAAYTASTAYDAAGAASTAQANAKTYTDTEAAKKVNIAQGSGNVDKVMITNASGTVTTTKFVHTSANNGSNVYSATATDKDTTIPSVELVEDIAARAAGEYVAKDQTSSNANKAMITNASGQVVPVAITNSGSGFVTGVSISNGAVTVSKSAIGAANVASGLVEGTAPITVSRNSTSGVYTVAATAGSIANGNTGLINGDKVYDAIDAMDSTSSGTGYLVTDVSETNGVVSVTRGNVQIPSGSETATTYASIWVE